MMESVVTPRKINMNFTEDSPKLQPTAPPAFKTPPIVTPKIGLEPKFPKQMSEKKTGRRTSVIVY